MSSLAKSLCIYKYEKYLKHVEVHESGAILIGKYFEVDGYAGRPIRVVTHAHADHLYGIEESIRNAKFIVATPITIDLIEVLGYVKQELNYYMKIKSQPLDYYKQLKVEDHVCTLLPADHIPGAAQVLVEISSENLRIGYTGDFKLTSRTEIIANPSVLVIESTYGNPMYIRTHKDAAPQVLVDLVVEGLQKYKRVYIYAYHGKMQEAMEILRSSGVEAPFVLPAKVYYATQLLERKYGLKVGEYFKEGNAIPSKGVVVFKHFDSARSRKIDGSALHIVLTGRLISEPYKKVDDYTYVVSLSDHADFSELVTYVEKSSPELVVVDGSRSNNAEALVDYLLSKGFCAIALPASTRDNLQAPEHMATR